MMSVGKKVVSVLRKTNIRTTHSRLRNDLVNSYTNHSLNRIALIQKHTGCSFNFAFKIYKTNCEILSTVNVKSLIYTFSHLQLQPDYSKTRTSRHKTERKTLKHWAPVLKQFGFPAIDALTFEFQNLMTKSPQELMSVGILTHDPVKYALSLLQDNVAERIGTQLSEDIYMKWPLTVIHEGALALLLAACLDCTKKVALHILQKQPLLMRHSVHELSKVLCMLMTDIGFDKSELLAEPQILLSSVEFLSYYLSSSGLERTKVKQRIKCNPHILVQSPGTVVELERIFKKFRITDQQLAYSGAFKKSPTVTAKYLNEIEEHTELKSLKCLPNYLSIVYNLDRVKRNLNRMKAAGHGTWTVHKLLQSPSKLEQQLVDQNDRCNAVEATILLASVLNEPVNKIRERLKMHPKYTKVSYHSAQLVVISLLENGVTKEQIRYALPVVLYDTNLVLETLSEMRTYPELSPFEEWQSHIGLVSLLVYYIERRTFFNFDGVLLTHSE